MHPDPPRLRPRQPTVRSELSVDGSLSEERPPRDGPPRDAPPGRDADADTTIVVWLAVGALLGLVCTVAAVVVALLV